MTGRTNLLITTHIQYLLTLCTSKSIAELKADLNGYLLALHQTNKIQEKHVTLFSGMFEQQLKQEA